MVYSNGWIEWVRNNEQVVLERLIQDTKRPLFATTRDSNLFVYWFLQTFNSPFTSQTFFWIREKPSVIAKEFSEIEETNLSAALADSSSVVMKAGYDWFMQRFSTTRYLFSIQLLWKPEIINVGDKRTEFE